MKHTLCCLGILLVACGVMAQQTQTYISINGITTRKSNELEPDSVFAGGAYHLIATIGPDKPDLQLEYRGLPQEPPAWLSIAVSEITLDSVGRKISELPSQTVELSYFIDSWDMLMDSLYKADPDNSGDYAALLYPDYQFYFDVPRELAGKKLRFAMSLNPLPFGPLAISEFSRKETIVFVAQPESAEDSLHAILHKANSLLAARRYETCLSFADSAMQLGFIAAAEPAQLAAKRIGAYDRALVYLDTLYSTFQTVILNESWNFRSQSAKDSIYYIRRGELLELIK